ncbi:uncharacterized protein LOC144139570 isoform X2 [Haemaphysalis longicornis]
MLLGVWLVAAVLTIETATAAVPDEACRTEIEPPAKGSSPEKTQTATITTTTTVNTTPTARTETVRTTSTIAATTTLITKQIFKGKSNCSAILVRHNDTWYALQCTYGNCQGRGRPPHVTKGTRCLLNATTSDGTRKCPVGDCRHGKCVGNYEFHISC